MFEQEGLGNRTQLCCWLCDLLQITYPPHLVDMNMLGWGLLSLGLGNRLQGQMLLPWSHLGWFSWLLAGLSPDSLSLP